MANKTLWAAAVFTLCFAVRGACAEKPLTLEERAQLGEVYSLERLKKFDQVKPMIEVLRQRYPENREIKWTYARVLGFGGDWQDATTVFKELCPDAKSCDEEMYETYGHILESKGPDPQTLPLVKQLADEHPGQKKIQAIYMEVLSWNSQDPKLLPQLEELHTQFPDDMKIAQVLGDSYYAAKDYDNAQKYYEQAMTQDHSPASAKKYVDVLLAQKKYDAAIAQMDTILAATPADQDLHFEHARVVGAAGKHEEAVQELKALLKDGYGKKEALVMLGDELRLLGRDEEALQIYQEVANGK